MAGVTVGNGTLVAVGGKAVAVGSVVGGKAVAVGGGAVAVGGTSVAVAVSVGARVGTAVAVGSTGTAVAVGGSAVGVSVGTGSVLYRQSSWKPSVAGVRSQSTGCAEAAAGKNNIKNTITGTNIRFVMVILIVHRENKS